METVETLCERLASMRSDAGVRAAATGLKHKLERFSSGTPVDASLDWITIAEDNELIIIDGIVTLKR